MSTTETIAHRNTAAQDFWTATVELAAIRAAAGDIMGTVDLCQKIALPNGKTLPLGLAIGGGLDATQLAAFEVAVQMRTKEILDGR